MVIDPPVHPVRSTPNTSYDSSEPLFQAYAPADGHLGGPAPKFQLHFNMPVQGLTPAHFKLQPPGVQVTAVTEEATDKVEITLDFAGYHAARLTANLDGTVTDESGTPLLNTRPYPIDLTNDSEPPKLLGVANFPNPPYGSSSLVRFLYRFDEPVTSVQSLAAAGVLTTVGLTGSKLANLAGTHEDPVLILLPGTGSGTAQVTIPAGVFADGYGNSYDQPIESAALRVDALIPTVTQVSAEPALVLLGESTMLSITVAAPLGQAPRVSIPSCLTTPLSGAPGETEFVYKVHVSASAKTGAPKISIAVTDVFGVTRTTNNSVALRIANGTLPGVVSVYGPQDPTEDSEIAVAGDGKGTLVAIWESVISTDIFERRMTTARSSDGGATWSVPQYLDQPPHTEPIFSQYKAAVATDGTDWMAAWMQDTLTFEPPDSWIGSNPLLMVSRSLDGGTSWLPPIPISDLILGQIPENWNSPSLSPDGAGGWLATWTTTSIDWSKRGAVFLSRGTQHGALWSAPVLLSDVASDSGAWRGNTKVAIDGAGTALCVWEEDVSRSAFSASTLYFVRSSDAGQTWSVPTPLISDIPPAQTSQFQPALHALSPGRFVVGFSSNYDGQDMHAKFNIYFVQTEDGGISWSAPAPVNLPASEYSNSFDQQFVMDGDNWTAVWGRQGPGRRRKLE